MHMSIFIDALAKISHDNSGSLKFLHKKVKNWHEVMLLLAGHKSSITVRLRNGKSYHLRVMDNYVVSYYKNRELRFVYNTSEERIHAILLTIGEFFDEPHSELDVKDRNVVDIGAYVGDTPIYFALNGAKHVYGLEPYPYSYELARTNISANKLDKKITMINAGCGSAKGSIKIGSDYKNRAGSDLKSSKSGKNVPIMPLDLLIKKYKIKNAALKIDCEGCEYDIILKAKKETLRKFSKMLIEYHYDYPKLEAKLRECGFEVSHTEPERMKNANAKDHEMYGGTILAELKEKRRD